MQEQQSTGIACTWLRGRRAGKTPVQGVTNLLYERSWSHGRGWYRFCHRVQPPVVDGFYAQADVVDYHKVDRWSGSREIGRYAGQCLQVSSGELAPHLGVKMGVGLGEM